MMSGRKKLSERIQFVDNQLVLLDLNGDAIPWGESSFNSLLFDIKELEEDREQCVGKLILKAYNGDVCATINLFLVEEKSSGEELKFFASRWTAEDEQFLNQSAWTECFMLFELELNGHAVQFFEGRITDAGGKKCRDERFKRLWWHIDSIKKRSHAE